MTLYGWMNKQTQCLFSFFSFSGLLNYTGPQSDRQLLVNREENKAGDERREEKSQEAELQVEAKALLHASSSLDDHIMEYLPPAVHKGEEH